MSHPLIDFIVAAGLLAITPGLDTALVLRAVLSGRRQAMSASAGICLGCLTWGFAVSLGLGAVLSASKAIYDGLRIAGAVYLVFLGVKMLRQSWLAVPRAAESDSALNGSTTLHEHARQWLLRGLLTNLLNPKVGVFYVSFLPMFIPAGVNASTYGMLLATIHATEGMLWFSVLVVAARLLSPLLRRPRVASTLNGLSGAVFLGFGGRLLLDRGR